MKHPIDRRKEMPPAVFTDGYYARRVANGDRPSYGYPPNHLPDAAISEMTTESGYVISLNKAE